MQCLSLLVVCLMERYLSLVGETQNRVSRAALYPRDREGASGSVQHDKERYLIADIV